MEYDPTQFRGSAEHYERGRPPYSRELAAVLAAAVGLDGRGVLADVGCGPGTVGLALGRLVERVVFVEPDPDMLAVARRRAAAALPGAAFLQTTAERLAEASLPPLRLIAFGQSFHRTDRDVVAELAHRLLAPGGALALITHDPAAARPAQPAGTSLIPHAAVHDLVHRYLGPQLRSGDRLGSSYGSEPFTQTLARSSFGAPRVVRAPGRADLVLGVDDVVAMCLSMSFASPYLLGSRVEEFAADLRALLLARNPRGRFWEWPGDTQIVIAEKSSR